MAQYLMSVWHDGEYAAADFDDSETQRMFAQVGEFNEELERAGAWVFGGGCSPTPPRPSCAPPTARCR